jgi:hypothetical protein
MMNESSHLNLVTEPGNKIFENLSRYKKRQQTGKYRRFDPSKEHRKFFDDLTVKRGEHRNGSMANLMNRAQTPQNVVKRITNHLSSPRLGIDRKMAMMGSQQNSHNSSIEELKPRYTQSKRQSVMPPTNDLSLASFQLGQDFEMNSYGGVNPCGPVSPLEF